MCTSSGCWRLPQDLAVSAEPLLWGLPPVQNPCVGEEGREKHILGGSMWLLLPGLETGLGIAPISQPHQSHSAQQPPLGYLYRSWVKGAGDWDNEEQEDKNELKGVSESILQRTSFCHGRKTFLGLGSVQGLSVCPKDGEEEEKGGWEGCRKEQR